MSEPAGRPAQERRSLPLPAVGDRRDPVFVRRLPSRLPFRALIAGCLSLAAGVCAADGLGQPDFNVYMQGKYVYERNCMVCHGVRGDGAGEMSPSLQPRPRSFREGLFKFRTTPFGTLPTADDLRHTIRYGLAGTGMGMFTHLPEDDLQAVIAYVQSFSRRWRKPENYAEPMALPAPPEWFKDERRKAEQAAAGRGLFLQHCAACHGPEADGRGPAAAALRDFWNQPVKPADLREPHLRCGSRPEDLYRLLATGMNGTPMISFEALLSAEQRWAIVAWIFTQKRPEVPNLGVAPPRELPPSK